MPSAHRPIFCCKDLREKIRVKVRFFIGVSQRTWTDFLSQTKHRTYFFYRNFIWRTWPNFLSELLCCDNHQNGRRGPIVGLHHTDQFFIGPKVSAHKPIFNPTKIGRCALGIRGDLYHFETSISQ